MLSAESRSLISPDFTSEVAGYSLSIVIPCLNEAETIGTCIRKAKQFLERSRIDGEVIVADNGSSDGSDLIAAELGARVVPVAERGYGSALRCGISAARGTWVIMGDGDDSYDLSSLDPFLKSLGEGSDLVMGNRFAGGIRPGAMPPLHKYLGNPVLSGLGRLFYGGSVGDFHCGLRGFRRSAILGLDLRTSGMEYASEMVVKATLAGLNISEVPTILYKDGRSRAPHLHTWRDGWRHLRFLFLYSPRWLFLYPGLLVMALGLGTLMALLPGPVQVVGVTFDVHTMLYAELAVIVGFQAIVFSVCMKSYAISAGLLPPDSRFSVLLSQISLERSLIAAILLVGVGLAGSVAAVAIWSQHSFGPLNPSDTLRIVIPMSLLVVVGFLLGLSSFFLGVLGIGRQR